jgi:large subunit ribosomal protein L21
LPDNSSKLKKEKRSSFTVLNQKTATKLSLTRFFLIEDKGKIVIGEPVIKDALVEGKVLDQLRGDKVIVFKKKRKKGYRVKNGHRQYFTQIEIVSIKEKAVRKSSKKEEGVTAEAVAETVVEKAVEKKPAVKKTAAAKTTEEAPAKKTGAKKGSSEKPAEKKPAAKKPAKGDA